MLSISTLSEITKGRAMSFCSLGIAAECIGDAKWFIQKADYANAFCTASTAVARTQPLVVQPVRVDAAAHEPWNEIGAEETRGVLLQRQAIGLAEIQPRVDFVTVGVGSQRDTPFCLHQMPASRRSASS
jgi:hypothetical protein